jgi:hypothetical protein
MAPTITVTLDDDLEGGPAVQTVRFSAGGTAYEIDVTNKKKAAAFRRKLGPVRRARPPGRAGPAPPGRAADGGPRARCCYRGVGGGAGHRGQRPRAHPGGCGGAV